MALVPLPTVIVPVQRAVGRERHARAAVGEGQRPGPDQRAGDRLGRCGCGPGLIQRAANNPIVIGARTQGQGDLGGVVLQAEVGGNAVGHAQAVNGHGRLLVCVTRQGEVAAKDQRAGGVSGQAVRAGGIAEGEGDAAAPHDGRGDARHGDGAGMSATEGEIAVEGQWTSNGQREGKTIGDGAGAWPAADGQAGIENGTDTGTVQRHVAVEIHRVGAEDRVSDEGVESQRRRPRNGLVLTVDI